MSRFKRVLAGTAVLMGGLTIAGSGSAGAFFDVPLTPGHFRNSGSFAFATMMDSAGNNAAVSVVYGRLIFRPKGGGGQVIPVNGTAVYATVQAADGVFANSCWLASHNPLTINRDMSATVTFDSSSPDVTPCPGMLVGQPLTAAAPQPLNIDPVQGFSGPVRFSVQWTPTQPADVVHAVTNGTCQAWTSVENRVSSDSRGTANGDFSATIIGFNSSTQMLETIPISSHFETALGGDAQISTQSDDEVVNGPASGNCGPYGS
jgi:hypothetical protein